MEGTVASRHVAWELACAGRPQVGMLPLPHQLRPSPRVSSQPPLHDLPATTRRHKASGLVHGAEAAAGDAVEGTKEAAGSAREAARQAAPDELAARWALSESLRFGGCCGLQQWGKGLGWAKHLWASPASAPTQQPALQGRAFSAALPCPSACCLPTPPPST